MQKVAGNSFANVCRLFSLRPLKEKPSDAVQLRQDVLKDVAAAASLHDSDQSVYAQLSILTAFLSAVPRC